MRIKILKGKLEGHSFEMQSDILLIGRAPESDIQIPDPSISKLHAKIFKSGEKYFIKDLKSCNGTWVDGRLIWPGNEIELRQGLRLSVGDTLLTLDDFDSGCNSSAFSYSIDLSSVKERESMDFLFKDRRIANRKNLELICEISEALLCPLELDAICEKILEYIFFSLKRISSCAILMVDRNNNIYKLMDKARTSENERGVTYSGGIVRQVVNDRNALMITDLDREEEIDPSESMELMGIKSVMCVPLISKDDIIGVLYAHSVDEPDGFRKDDLFMFVALSSYASIAIDNATQYTLKKQSRSNIDIQFILRHKLETIKTLSRAVSHEFNNLLMCIQGEASLLLYGVTKEDPKYNRIKKIEHYIGRGTELSELASGFSVTPQNPKTCSDLNRLSVESINGFANLPENTFQVEPAPDLWPVNIVESQIQDALTKLCSFFISINNRGVINIKCENLISDAYRRELTGIEKSGLVMVSVRDGDIYLEKNELLEIFTPEINLEKSAGLNTGTGLIAAYWIIEKNMGRLVVTSDKERGTEFCIYFPALAEKQAEGVQALG